MIGDRMKQARLAAGLTLEDVVRRLAEQGVSITRAGISKYEHNKSTPKAAFLLKLAHALSVRPAYFLEEPGVTVEWLAFRKHATLTKANQLRIQASAQDVAHAQHWLQTTLYPQESPVLPSARDVCTAEDAEAASAALREAWHLGEAPIESMTQAFEDHGGIAVSWHDGEDEFDGLAGKVNGEVPLAVINLSVSLDRRRFNLAHELGHMVMRCEGLADKASETLAHRFAAAFLVPASVARHELGARRRHLGLEELGGLKEKYGLSMQAWARRALDLEIVDAAQYKTWCIEFSSRGWRRAEPYVFRGVEEPTRLKQMTLHALAEGIITEERANELCPGCIEPRTTARPEGRRYTARELMKLPREERDRILAEAAAEAEEEYRTNPALSEFEAFGEDDLYDEYPE